MSDKSVSVTETMDGAKDENADVATAPATNPVAATGDDVPTVTVNDDRTKTQAVENESTDDRKPDVAAEETGVKVIEGNDSATDDDKLTAAMASTTISPSDESKPKDSDQNPSESVSDGQPQTQAPPVTAPKNTEAIVDETKANDPKECPKLGTDEEANSTSQFEDAREYVEDEDDGDHGEQERPRNDDEVNHQDNVPDGESGGEELLNKEEAEENGDGEEPTVASVPVPVDDDTNDPQYIPRRGRFYEHDDRMAYSTTSSEGSESEDEYDYSGKDDEEGSGDHRIRRRRTGGRKCKSTTEVDTETIDTTIENSKMSSKRVLAISKVDAAVKNSAEKPVLETSESAKKPGSRKSRDIDSLSRWDHDMYDEREQTRKTRDELLASYGYDIREESEAPRARRHHKYGRAATAKYTRNWQDTKAYSGASVQQSSKVKRGGMAQRSAGPSKNKSKSDEYSAEFPALDGSKLSKSTAVENPSVVENSSQKQQQISLPVHEQERNTIVTTSTTGPSQRKEPPPKTSTKYVNSPTNRHHYQDQQNGGSPSSSSHNKNYFNRNSADSNDGKEKNIPFNKDYSSPATNSNFFNRKPPPQYNNGNINQHQNYKQHHYNNQGAQGYNQHNQHTPSAPRGRNFHQNHNSPQQYNRDRYFAKGSAPPSSSNQPYDQQHHTTIAPTTAGTGRTQHSGGHYHQFNNRQYENETQKIEQSAPPVVRSSKRYSVQSRRELPDPVLNFGGMSKTPQPSQQSVPQHPQQNGLVMQEQQQTMQQIQQPPPQQIQQPQAMQIQQQIHQPPPPIQLQQYHPPIQQLHPHHGMVLDHNTGMMVMAAGDPSMYQLYAAPPQYATGVTPGSNTGGADDPNAVAAAAALQMLAAQAAVYQPVQTGAPGVTPPPSGTQSLQQQQPETFMTTYYQPQQQPQQQPPPRRVNLAIPIVAPPPEHTINLNQQGTQKTTISPTPPPTAASIN